MPLIYVVAVLILVVAVARLSNTYIPMPGIMKTAMNVVLALIVVGMVLFAINTYIPMAGSIRALLNVVVFLATVVFVLQAFGLWASTVAMWHRIRHHTAEATQDSEPRIHPAR